MLLMVKERVFNALTDILKSRYRAMQEAWSVLLESNQQEGKSSAGDKHETGTAMIHLEFEQMGRQVEEMRRQLEEVYQFCPENCMVSDQVVKGSLVTTNIGLFYMVTGFGKLQLAEGEVFVIGKSSPAGQGLFGKSVGDGFEWGRVKGIVMSIS